MGTCKFQVFADAIPVALQSVMLDCAVAYRLCGAQRRSDKHARPPAAVIPTAPLLRAEHALREGRHERPELVATSRKMERLVCE